MLSHSFQFFISFNGTTQTCFPKTSITHNISAKSKIGNWENTEEKQYKHPRKSQKRCRKHGKTQWETVGNSWETEETQHRGNHHNKHTENETNVF